MEHPSAIHKRLAQAKVTLEELIKEIEENRRLLGHELGKKEPSSHRVENYEDIIRKLEKQRENIPFQIVALEKDRGEAKQHEERRERVAGMAGSAIPRLQKLSRHLLILLRECDEINDEIFKIIKELINLERSAKITIARPFCTNGYQSIKPITQSIESEVKGNGRTIFHWPGKDWPA